MRISLIRGDEMPDLFCGLLKVERAPYYLKREYMVGDVVQETTYEPIWK